MVTPDILEIIHQIELETRKHVSGPLSGDYKNKLKGSGFEFEQLRDYQPGDDVRFIDWKSSARTDKILVKQYLEDKNRQVYILVDISASTHFGSQDLKSNLIKKLASVLSFVALHNKDSVGLVLFTDKIEFLAGAKSGRANVMWLLKKLFEFKPENKITNLKMALDDFFKVIKNKKALICILSDFQFDLNLNFLKSVAMNHEIIAFRCLDELEKNFVDAGILNIQDIESGKKLIYNTKDYNFNENLTRWNLNQKNILKNAKIDCFDAVSGKSFFNELVGFLAQRVHY